jgi:hypothetical protein
MSPAPRENIWKHGRNNDKYIWMKINERYIHIERQNVGVTMRDINSLMLYNILRSKCGNNAVENKIKL